MKVTRDRIVVPGETTPFSSARAFLRHVPVEADSASAHAIRFVTHATAAATASLNERQSAQGQIRWRGREGCLAGLRQFGRVVRERFPQGVEVVVAGDLGRADHDFFGVLAKVAPLSLTFTSQTLASWAAPDATPDGEERPDEETARVLGDHSWIHTGLAASGDWGEFRARALRYLTCGDSWTAAWLADRALETGLQPSAAAADVMAMAYRGQHRFGMAETCLRIAHADTGLPGIQAAYSLSLLYSRNYPLSIRSMKRAEDILNDAWRRIETSGVAAGEVLEKAMNRNALAFVLSLTGREDEAVRTLRTVIGQLAPDREAHRVPLSILCNNLGRVLSRMPDSVAAAEETLKEATELDPRYPDFWFDLAKLLADHGEPERALAVVRQGISQCLDTPTLHALAGYLLLGLEHHDAAYEHYARAAALDPLDQDTVLTCARTACLAERYDDALTWLDRLASSATSDDIAPEAELLRIEADSFLQGQSTADTVQRVLALGERYPDSALVRANVLAVQGGRAS